MLYRAWDEQGAGNVNISEWIDLNIERVETLRERAAAKTAETALDRKTKWDKKAKERPFEVGDSVLVRKPGMCTKLEETWEGSFKIIKVNSPISCAVDFGYRKSPSIHAQLLKKFYQPPCENVIARVTSVLEPDSPHNDIRDRLAGVEVQTKTMSDEQRQQILQ